MSIVFPPTATSNLAQPLIKGAVSLLNPATIQPTSVVAKFNWQNDYSAGSANPDVNILVNIAMAGGAQQALDQIRSVKIDNLGNSAPVYVTFIDTGDTIVAPPNTAVWENVVTNQKIANVILLGADNTVSNTAVFFTNFIVPNYVDAEISQAVALWKASATISQGANITNQNYGVPALGDTTISQMNLGLPGPAQPVLFEINTGFFYITGMQMQLLFTSPGEGLVGTLVLKNMNLPNTGAFDLWNWAIMSRVTVGIWDGETITSSNLNLKIACSDPYVFAPRGSIVTAGIATLILSGTYNPT